MIKKLSNGYWNMPEGYRNRLDLLRKRKAYYQPYIECPICGGCGFPEAYQDELWTAQAEKELESIHQEQVPRKQGLKLCYLTKIFF